MNIYNFIEEYKLPITICNGLLDYYKKNKEYKFNRIDIKDTTEVHFFNDSNDQTIKKFFNELSKCVIKYYNKYKLKNNIRTNKTNKIQHYKSKTGFIRLHCERNKQDATRELVYMAYLNTVNDGGGTEFPFQNKIFSAEKGKLIVWPAGFTHPHKGIVSPTEEKYIVTGWFDLI
tara:strand:+ start:213 stop:734 length:522 start_codon:yes stop_codon:yes gene_type:complete